MEILEKIVGSLQNVNVMLPLVVLPVLCPILVVVFGIFGKRKIYPALSLAIVSLSFALLCAQTEIKYALFFLGAFTAWAALLGCFLFLPPLKKLKRKKNNKVDKMYEMFHEDLSVLPESGSKPPKVCCFEEQPAGEVQESAPQLAHADALIAKLSESKLVASDRLEVDALKRKLDLYRNKPLTKEESRSLNDCLSAILKLTAKYKL